MSTHNPTPETEKKPVAPEKKELTQDEKDQLVADGLDWYLRNDMPSKDAIEVCGEVISKLRGQTPPAKEQPHHHEQHTPATTEQYKTKK